ncbi:hypothetical protein TNCV_1870801 [Trichonephila clavipes]|nr:hypothetical protein TNCV_1870801 [Trichonephila clavipes]
MAFCSIARPKTKFGKPVGKVNTKRCSREGSSRDHHGNKEEETPHCDAISENFRKRLLASRFLATFSIFARREEIC